MPKSRTTDVLGQLRELTEAVESAYNARRDALVRVMSKSPRDRGATTYQIADAVKLSRQQVHQIYRDATGSEPES